MRFTTDKFHAVGDLIILEIGMEIPVVHPFGHDAQLQALGHLDSLDCQDIFVFDVFGNQHFLAEPLKSCQIPVGQIYMGLIPFLSRGSRLAGLHEGL
jgi:TRAP-type mannitol/chloroaromatic compound transport system permease large subunit